MQEARMAKIHPTAIVDPGAELAEDVEIGAFSVVEGDTVIDSGCVLRPHAVVRRHTRLGRGNRVDSFAVLGGEPQDLKFDPGTVSWLRIGDDNVFREGVTISRATGEGLETVVGSRTYWMAGSHAGHNATVEDDCILVNGAAVAGHAVVSRRTILSAHAMVHQFCWVGEGVMTQGGAGISMHAPPFTLLAGISRVVGLNAVGLKRNRELTDEDRAQIRQAFRITYRSGLTVTAALAEMDRQVHWGAAAGRFREFVRRVLAAEKPHARGLCPLRLRSRGD
jgi:UDP-N-acetylglucosamine acyltransferase